MGKVAVLKCICCPREANCFCAEVMLQLVKKQTTKNPSESEASGKCLLNVEICPSFSEASYRAWRDDSR